MIRLRKWILLTVLFSMLVGCGGPWSSGDRVLVSKLAYDAGLSEPNRFDVVVFKFPGNRNEADGPMKKGTPTNYIKRLLGLPGELIAIFFGRVYRWVPGEKDAPPFDDSKEDPLQLFRFAYTHQNDEKTRFWFEEGKDKETGAARNFEILRQPPRVMLALRRNVYDNDYQPRDLKGKLDRWNPSKTKGWKADQGTGFFHEGNPAEEDWLRYQHLTVLRHTDRPVAHDEKPRLITDVMDYNSFQTVGTAMTKDGIMAIGRPSDHTPKNPNWVGDLMLECNVEVVEGKGEFWIELNKGIYRFQARWDLTSGQCTLFRINNKDGKLEQLAQQSTRVKGPGSYLLRFANFDSRLTAWVDRDLPFGDGQAYDPPELRRPEDKTIEDVLARRGPTENDLRPASICSKGAHVKISHLKLWRDTYYTAVIQDGDFHIPNAPAFEDREKHRAFMYEFWSDPAQWDRMRKPQSTTMYVQPGHYLCLGDNSQASSDSRDWGTVPARLMLGRALVVYFPFDRIGPIH